jgi:hypothetical protein
MTFVSHRKHTYVPSRSVTGIAFLFVCRWRAYLTGNTYRPPRPITGIVSLFITRGCSYLTGNNYRPSRRVYGYSLCFLYVYYIRTSQGKHSSTSTAWYRSSFIFYMKMMFIPHRRNTHWHSRPFTGVALLFYMKMLFIPHRRNTHRHPGLLALLFSKEMSFVPHRKHSSTSAVCSGTARSVWYFDGGRVAIRFIVYCSSLSST